MKAKLAFDSAMHSIKEAFFRKGELNFPTKIVGRSISDQWDNFNVVEGDLIKKVPVGDEIYAVLYFIPANKKFPPHFHENIETAIILKGEVTIETPCYKKRLKETESFRFEANEWHSLASHQDTYLFIQFHPPFEENWEATF
tara:strand:+ start:13320 stop:13745 length:426 start_codon:yes stop_codon:yes gene_type:complete